MKNEIRCLTGLRGIAALIVVVSHLANEGALPHWLGARYGQIGLMIFFILSGFLMGKLYAGKEPDRPTLAAYAKARFGRVGPLYLLLVAVSVAATAVSVPNWHYVLSGKYILGALLFFGVPNEMWTIPVEVQFYVFFVVFWLLLRRGHPIIGLAGMGLLMLAIAPVATIFSGPAVLPVYAPAFVLGLLLGTYWTSKVRPFLERRQYLLNVLGPFLLAAALLNLPAVRDSLGLLLPIPSQLLQIWWDPATYALTAMAFLCVALQVRSLGFLASRPLHYLGDISYGVYLFHPLVIGLLAPELSGDVALVVLTFAGTIGLAHVSRRYFERPMQRLVRGGSTRSRSAARVGAPGQ